MSVVNALSSDVSRSYALYERAVTVIPGGTQTISKRPETYVLGEWPVYWDSARNAHIRDIDGNEYIDYVMALGPIILGYSNPAVDAAVAAQLKKGSLTTLQSPLEVDVAEKLVQHVPSSEMVRFTKTGAEATSTALRLARTYTGKEKVISCGYAGWHDWWVAKQRGEGARGGTSCAGIPKALFDLSLDVRYGDTASLQQLCDEHGHNLACIMVDMAEITDGGTFLDAAQCLARKHGAVLVFDEIITGFRMGLGGAQAVYNVTPDLSTFGKAIANGLPLAAVTGMRDIMQAAERTWISSTFGGEALSLAAAAATIAELEKPETLERLWAYSARLDKAFRKAASEVEGVEIFGQLSMPGLRFTKESAPDPATAKEFVRHMLKAGILTRPNYVFFVTASLTDEDVARTIEAVEQSLETIALPAS